MAISPEFMEEMRSRLTLSDLVGKRVKLVKRGKEHSGLCPFHSEKSPSFTVNDQKQFYHCFGCGAHGDALKFVMETEGLEFRDAVEKLAGMAGLEVPRSTPQAAQQAKKRASQHDIMEKAAKWFEAQLGTQAANAAREYLRNRGLRDDVIKFFRLGYAPNMRDALIRHLEADTVTMDEMVLLGLVKDPEDDRKPFDFFRDRIIYPVTDRRGKVIAFGARAIGDAKPKYLNSPDTPLFNKSETLYGLATAREAAHKDGEIIVAEGYMDVIALAAAGFPQAVAPLGTAVTEEQIKLLWRMAPEPVMCLDGDNAGQKAALRAAHRALPMLEPGKSLRFAMMPTGEDPDSLIQKQGKNAMRDALDEARSLSQIIWTAEANAQKLDTPERQAAFQSRLGQIVADIGDATVRGFYERFFEERLADRFGMSQSRLHDQAEASANARQQQQTRHQQQHRQTGGQNNSWQGNTGNRNRQDRPLSPWQRKNDKDARRVDSDLAGGRVTKAARPGSVAEKQIMMMILAGPDIFDLLIDDLLEFSFQHDIWARVLDSLLKAPESAFQSTETLMGHLPDRDLIEARRLTADILYGQVARDATELSADIRAQTLRDSIRHEQEKRGSRVDRHQHRDDMRRNLANGAMTDEDWARLQARKQNPK